MTMLGKCFDNQYFDGLQPDCNNSSALAIELLQSCTKPSIFSHYVFPTLDIQDI